MILRAAATLLALAGPASATQDGWPALFDVTDVAAGDVLNVREAPDAGSPVIGTLAHDARGIEVIGPNDRLTWGIVNVGERAGWVSLRYLSRRPGQWDGAFPEIRSCFGTEPFWNLTREPGGTLVYSAIDDETLAVSETIATGAEARRDRFALSAEGPDGRITVVLSKALCTDGMSDRTYGIGADVLVSRAGGTVLHSGCCSLSGQ